MNDTGTLLLPPDTPNPYSPAAIARVTLDGPRPVTIRTSSVAKALRHLEQYLRPVDRSRSPRTEEFRPGSVIALTGGFGAGKTHLCVEIASTARAAGAHAIYLDAQATSFVALYKLYVGRFSQTEITVQVRRHYAEAVAALLARSPLTADVAEALLAGRIDAQALVSGLELPETEIIEEVHHRLTRVTDAPAFATALTLLLRPGFARDAWDWLCGSTPSELLVERGVTEAINTEERALEAIGVLALLHQRPGGRFVLVIDELEKVLYGIGRDQQDTQAAFKTLLSVCANAGVFLVLSGIPDILNLLEDDVRERIGVVIPLQPLTTDDVVWYLEQTLRPVTGRSDLQPFTPDAVSSLSPLAHGVPRDLIRLCHHAFTRALVEQVMITAEIVHEVARDHLGFSSTADIREEVGRILGNHGWRHTSQVRLGPPEAQVDELVYLPSTSVRCGVLVIDPPGNDTAVEALGRRVNAVRTARPEMALVLVVNGPMPPRLQDQLRELVGSDPLGYRLRSFGSDLVDRIRSVERALTPVSETEPLGGVLLEMSRMGQQQTTVRQAVDLMATRLDDLRATTDHQLASVRARLESLVDRLSPEAVPVTAAAPSSSQLPANVSRAFAEAMEILEQVRGMEAVFTTLFEDAGRAPDGRVMVDGGLRVALRSEQASRALGVVLQLRSLVQAFQDAVDLWFADPPSNREGQLRSLCRAYDTVYTYVPVSQLAGTAVLARAASGQRGGEEQVGTLIERITEVLYGLGARVETLVLGAAPA